VPRSYLSPFLSCAAGCRRIQCDEIWSYGSCDAVAEAPLIYDLKPASTRIICIGDPTRKHTRQIDRFVPSPDVSVKRRGHRAGTERCLSRFLITREIHELSWYERDRRH
jgi:hypothetical protein